MPLEKERSATIEDVESLTIHGISRVAFARSKYTRIIWLVLCISASISFVIVTVNSFINYYQYNIVTHRTVRQYNKLTLPAITFCHTNYYHPFTFYAEDPPTVQTLPENCSVNDSKDFANTMNWIIFDFACRMFFGTTESNASAMGAESLKYFRFPQGFEITPNKEPCITLNRNSALVQQAEGEKYGLHMILYNEGGAALHDVSANEPLTDNREGIYAMLHDPKQVVPMGDRIVIPPGYHTHISITKNVFKRLPHPYPSKCKNNRSNRDSIYPGKNTQQMCFSSCAYKQVYKACPGVIPEMKVFMKAPSFPLLADIYNVSFWKCVENSVSQLDYLKCDCPQHCNDETYTTVINRNPWPQLWQVPSFMKLINDVEGKANRTLPATEIREKLIKLTIYYSEFRENASEEQPFYDLFTILSDLGGQMGLFMGASLLSLAEIIALTATCLRRYLCRLGKSIELSPSPRS